MANVLVTPARSSSGTSRNKVRKQVFNPQFLYLNSTEQEAHPPKSVYTSCMPIFNSKRTRNPWLHYVKSSGLVTGDRGLVELAATRKLSQKTIDLDISLFLNLG